MQTTKISAYSLRGILRDNINGIRTAGYTVRPGFSNGLFTGGRVTPMSGYQGFGNLNCFHGQSTTDAKPPARWGSRRCA